eukprot:GHRR01017418.1.p1 GENE.GHRR01017418.1~~GHRR01017418.1.p1  ORF type:complete len:244 (-),score=89.63 GHRR01017418.1:1425-2075(-)
MTALNFPAALLVLGFLFSIDEITGFEVTSLIELPPPYGIIVVWAVVLPVLYLLSTSITNLILRDHTILKGPCPNCATDNFTYFGDIFTVSGNKGQNVLECSNCQADLTYDANKRVIVVSRTSEEKQQEKAAAAARKAAAAAKKAAQEAADTSGNSRQLQGSTAANSTMVAARADDNAAADDVDPTGGVGSAISSSLLIASGVGIVQVMRFTCYRFT